MFNLLKDTLGLVEDIVTLPTDALGLTNFSTKKQARAAVDMALARGDINNAEHKALMSMIDNEKTLNI